MPKPKKHGVQAIRKDKLIASVKKDIKALIGR